MLAQPLLRITHPMALTAVLRRLALPLCPPSTRWVEAGEPLGNLPLEAGQQCHPEVVAQVQLTQLVRAPLVKGIRVALARVLTPSLLAAGAAQVAQVAQGLKPTAPIQAREAVQAGMAWFHPSPAAPAITGVVVVVAFTACHLTKTSLGLLVV